MDIIVLYFFIRLFNRIVQPHNIVKMTGWKIKHGRTIRDASRHFNYTYLGRNIYLKTVKGK